MEAVAQLSVPIAQIARYETDYILCIICQTDEVEELVTKPTAYDKLLNCIKERAWYGDKQYPEVVRHLGCVGSVDLKAVGATLHPKCHKDAVHADKCQRAKKRYEQQISSKQISSANIFKSYLIVNSRIHLPCLHSLAINTI